MEKQMSVYEFIGVLLEHTKKGNIQWVESGYGYEVSIKLNLVRFSVKEDIAAEYTNYKLSIFTVQPIGGDTNVLDEAIEGYDDKEHYCQELVSAIKEGFTRKKQELLYHIAENLK